MVFQSNLGIGMKIFKRISIYKQITFLMLVAGLCLAHKSTQAQTNLALTATASHSGGGSTGAGYGPNLYNNNAYSTNCAVTGTNQWGWVSSGGWILFTWSSSQNINSIRLLKGNRPMTSCAVQYWNGSSYVTITNYSSSVTCDHTITFGNVSTTRIRLASIGGSNPNHREIQIFGGTPCVNGSIGSTITPTCSEQTISVGSGERRNFNVVSGCSYRFRLFTCPSGWTMQLTGRNTSDTQVFQTSGGCTLTYNWTANFTGTLRLNINRSNCQAYQGNNSAVLGYRQNPAGSGGTTTWIGAVSGTNNWNVDRNWTACRPNINVFANIPNTGQQPGITAAAAAKTLTIATGRTLTIGCSNCLTIGDP